MPVSSPAAITHTFAPTLPGGGNCYPFGIGLGGGSWNPYFGTVYKNLPAFVINPNDVLAFDNNQVGNADVQLQIEAAPTTANGGDAPAGAFTTLVPNTQVPQNPRGNAVTGDFEMQFRSAAKFTFAGGGLILRFSNPAGQLAADADCTATFAGNLADGTDPTGLFVERYYNDIDGLPPYSSDPNDILPFRLVLSPPNSFSFGKPSRNKQKATATLPVTVPGPGTLSLSGAGVQAQTAAGAMAGTAVSQAGTVKLRVKPKGKKKRKLTQKGKLTVTVDVTFTPTGGDPLTETTKVKLKKKKTG